MGKHILSLRVLLLLFVFAILLAACPAAAPTGTEVRSADSGMEEEGEVLTILYWRAASLRTVPNAIPL